MLRPEPSDKQVSHQFTSIGGYMSLINKLKGDHQVLAATLAEVKQLGITDPKGIAKLKSAKAALLAHLKHEEVELYPVLQNAAKNDPKLAVLLKSLGDEMATLSKAALDFFNKYENGGDNFEYARDYGKLIGALGIRIQREESTIYVEFEKLAQKKVA